MLVLLPLGVVDSESAGNKEGPKVFFCCEGYLRVFRK